MIYSAVTFFFMLALVAVSAFAPDYSSYTFEQFESEFGKTYSDNVARNHAAAMFHHNLAKIASHNARNDQSFYMKVNQFADLSESDVVSRYTGYNKKMAKAHRFGAAKPEQFKYDGKALPTAVDWRTKNAVTPVKDQGSCGSCWAFSATASIESQLILQASKTLILSPQDVVSCTPNPQHCGGTGGCAGATPELAFAWAKAGIALDSTVPYTAKDGTCKNVTRAATVNSFVQLGENNATDLLAAVATIGPISVSVDASSWSFYGSGIFNGCNSANPDINHAVQLVGYGTENGQDYWLVRNSWGASWGEKGYIRLYRGAKETCGTDTHPQDGSGCDGGPATVKVCGTCGIWYDNSVPTSVSLL